MQKMGLEPTLKNAKKRMFSISLAIIYIFNYIIHMLILCGSIPTFYKSMPRNMTRKREAYLPPSKVTAS